MQYRGRHSSFFIVNFPLGWIYVCTKTNRSIVKGEILCRLCPEENPLLQGWQPGVVLGLGLLIWGDVETGSQAQIAITPVATERAMTWLFCPVVQCW
jgi:hypothetical protein